MKLAFRLMLLLLIGVIALTLFNGYAVIQLAKHRLEQQTEQIAQEVGEQVRDEIKQEGKEVADERLNDLVRRQSERYPTIVVRVVEFGLQSDPYRRPHARFESIEVFEFDRPVKAYTVDQEGRSQMSAYVPLTEDDQSRALEVSQTAEPLEGLIADTVKMMILQTTASIVLGALFIGLLGIRFVSQPLQKLIEKTKSIGQGNLDDPLELSGQGEFTQLADALNDMCADLRESRLRLENEAEARVSAVEQLRHADRLQTVGRLASGVAHELGTPLNVVSGRADLIASGKLSGEEITKSAATIKSESVRMTKIIRELLDFARRRAPNRATVNLWQIIAQTRDLLQPIAKKQKVEFKLVDETAPRESKVDVGQIQQVLTNLFVNAIEAMPQGGTVTVSIEQVKRRRPDEDIAPQRAFDCIAISDQGQGIGAEDLAHLFEPFFTTKDVGKGTGLGLCVSFGMVEDHGGWIDVESVVGQGSTFRIYIPNEAEA